MKNKVLQSMTDFVIEVYLAYGSDDKEKALKMCYDYSEFLRQKLELWMFVPCDEDGKPMEEPIKCCNGSDCGCMGYPINYTPEELDEYQKAKDRVMFEGWAYHEDNVVEFKGDGYAYYLDMDEQTTLEDFTENEAETRVLTPTAQKMIYG